MGLTPYRTFDDMSTHVRLLDDVVSTMPTNGFTCKYVWKAIGTNDRPPTNEYKEAFVAFQGLRKVVLRQFMYLISNDFGRYLLEK